MKVYASGDLEDDGLDANDLEIIDNIKSFFDTNYKPASDPLENVYLRTQDIFDSLMNSFPNSPLTIEIVNTWLDGRFKRLDIGDSTGIKIVWALARKSW